MCARGRFFCLLWGHQEPWESDIFREFLKFKIYQGFWIKKVVFFQIFYSYELVVHFLTPSLKSERWCFYRFTSRNIVLYLLLNYKPISLVFSKYWFKTTRRQNIGNRTNWRPEFFVIYWLESLIVFGLIIYQILLTCFVLIFVIDII